MLKVRQVRADLVCTSTVGLKQAKNFVTLFNIYTKKVSLYAPGLFDP